MRFVSAWRQTRRLVASSFYQPELRRTPARSVVRDYVQHTDDAPQRARLEGNSAAWTLDLGKARLLRFGRNGCSPDRVRTNHRAEELERRVWEVVSELMRDPGRLREDLERMIESEGSGAHEDPEREAKAWLEKLAEMDDERRGYLRLAAKGRMSEGELDEALSALDGVRETAERELAAVQDRREAIGRLKRDKESLLEHYADVAPEALDSLAPEERHQFYKMLGLKVIVRPDATVEVSGHFGEGPPKDGPPEGGPSKEVLPKGGLSFSNPGSVPGLQEDLPRHLRRAVRAGALLGEPAGPAPQERRHLREFL